MGRLQADEGGRPLLGGGGAFRGPGGGEPRLDLRGHRPIVCVGGADRGGNIPGDRPLQRAGCSRGG
eukprot:9475468-Pyramimonas_sp.AAC.2